LAFQAVLNCLCRDLPRLTDIVSSDGFEIADSFSRRPHQPIPNPVGSLPNLAVVIPYRGDEEAFSLELLSHLGHPFLGDG
jgi:hypothetical protein